MGVERAHPRSRGEHSLNTLRVEAAPGSSPLTRGAPHGGVLPDVPGGLIPAHAGSTANPCWFRSRPRAHPRSRGEHPKKPLMKSVKYGSSPLTRGARTGQAAGGALIRLIPAHAGSTKVDVVKHLEVRAHPRTRGEHLSAIVGCLLHVGSSPLTRGAHTGTQFLQQLLRLIPAHAGSTG